MCPPDLCTQDMSSLSSRESSSSSSSSSTTYCQAFLVEPPSPRVSSSSVEALGYKLPIPASLIPVDDDDDDDAGNVLR